MQQPSSPSPVALITGVSRRLGLGYAVAQELAERGYYVLLTARDVGQAQELAADICHQKFAADALALDLADQSSIRALADRLGRDIDRLDVLVNNASAMPDFQVRSPLSANMDVVRSIFAVSVFGTWELTQALLPLLRQAPAARIVNVSSAAAMQIMKPPHGPIFSPAYSLAKYALNGLTTMLATSLADTPILVNAVDPGSVATHPERGDDAGDRSPAEAAKGVVWAATLGPDGPTGGFFHDGQPVVVR
ncbi:SDR family NAD(P)-dependent oxidoreductase [Sphingomonas psychrotolerans]|uniref:SDR family NAD(P)-dependent oxidoreductase n=1 Tax=Sphingomonas psychrotolerans TaxID=1327635 RepID=A0ABU3NAS5_9SPHN|nr:SDR family NAD(P)-dependent oxidoreductase [Sphingomonas psychrotolerans]MDT8760576.1 SDR family NAD(P)-dependent oxidoreductase [Sphingomonas psychrotolerans]